jgi:hypothetical protein
MLGGSLLVLAEVMTLSVVGLYQSRVSLNGLEPVISFGVVQEAHRGSFCAVQMFEGAVSGVSVGDLLKRLGNDVEIVGSQSVELISNVLRVA